MTAVKEAAITYRGNLIGISEPRTVGDVYQLVNRPQEAVAALRTEPTLRHLLCGDQRLQPRRFRLYRAVGFPARGVVCDHPVGEVQNVDTSRPAGMAPDCPHVLSCPCPSRDGGDENCQPALVAQHGGMSSPAM